MIGAVVVGHTTARQQAPRVSRRFGGVPSTLVTSRVSMGSTGALLGSWSLARSAAASPRWRLERGTARLPFLIE